MLLLLCCYLSYEEALLHVSGLYGSEKLHGLILALAGLQLLPSPQHALQQHQTHTEDYLHSWERDKSPVIEYQCEEFLMHRLSATSGTAATTVLQAIVLPSQRNMSQTRNTEAQGSVLEKAHINHSVM